MPTTVPSSLLVATFGSAVLLVSAGVAARAVLRPMAVGRLPV